MKCFRLAHLGLDVVDPIIIEVQMALRVDESIGYQKGGARRWVHFRNVEAAERSLLTPATDLLLEKQSLRDGPSYQNGPPMAPDQSR